MKYRTDHNGFGIDLLVALIAPIGVVAIVSAAIHWVWF